MSDTTNNGDEQIQPGDVSATTAHYTGDIVQDGPITRVENLDVTFGPEDIQAVDARDTPPDGMQVEMLEDQPTPEEPTIVDPATRKDDVLIGLTNTGGGVNFSVMTAEKPDPDNNLAHFFSQFLARAFPWLMEQASREFTLQQQNAALTERTRIKLVSVDGKPLER